MKKEYKNNFVGGDRDMIKIAGCGDVFIANRMPQDQYDGFDELQEFLLSHDIRFGNLEATVHSNEGYPSLFPGGVIQWQIHRY